MVQSPWPFLAAHLNNEQLLSNVSKIQTNEQLFLEGSGSSVEMVVCGVLNFLSFIDNSSM